MAFGFFFILLMTLLLAAAAVASFIFWIWMLINCAQNKYLTDNEKLLWILLIFFTHFVGSLVYFFVGRVPRRPTIFYTPPQQVPYPPQRVPYPPYQTGYQRPDGPPGPQSRQPQPPPEQGSHQSYEQPRASYPEQTQE